MYHVKLSIANDNVGCNRQIPGGSHIIGDYCFHINENITTADFWVVYSKGQRKTETCECSRDNTIFITGEPETVYHYSKGFVRQFALVLSVQEKLPHKNMIMSQPAQPWFVGRTTKFVNGKMADVEYNFGYDFLKVAHPEKTKLISIITSSKCFTQGHKDRIKFALALKEHYGDSLDLFGHGFKPFDDKWDVVAPYKYHICIENSSFPHYWTEKLADSFLGEAFPLYYGCPNLNEYFNKKSYRYIDIHDIDSSIKTIDAAIGEDLYLTNKTDILESKRKVLDEYNLFSILIKEFEKMDPSSPKRLLQIKSDTSFLDIKKVKIMLIDRIKNKIAK